MSASGFWKRNRSHFIDHLPCGYLWMVGDLVRTGGQEMEEPGLGGVQKLLALQCRPAGQVSQ